MPRQRPFLNQVLWVCCGLLFWAVAAGSGSAAEDTPEHWLTVESKYTVILYRTPEDLARVDRQLKYGPANRGLKHLLAPRSPDSIADKTVEKVDALFERVQEILEMRRSTKKPTLFIFPNRDQLHRAYRQLFDRPCRIRAWYHYSTNGVYLNVQDMHEGMLAHELAHAIIDHYLVVRPPAATAEILARYVDSHLKE